MRPGIDDIGVTDHFGVPAAGRTVDAGGGVATRPGDAVGRLRVADAVGLRKGADRIPHPIDVAVADDARPPQSIFIVAFRCQAQGALPAPVDPVAGVRDTHRDAITGLTVP